MVISRLQRGLRMISHPDHGRLAGQLCRRWGNDTFTAPASGDALLIAATHHDDGWLELDGQPAFNPEQERPAHFLELALEQTVGPYGRGVDSVYERDPLAGALVSMHWAGLYRTRWGLQPGEPVRDPLAAEVVTDQERRWVAALRDVWGGRGLRSEFEQQAWYAYEVLQALDFLALALCLLDTDQPSAPDAPLPMPGTLPRIDQPAGPRSILSVPVAAGGDHVDVTVRVSAPRVVALEPYPFSEPSFDVSVPARWLEDRRYGSPEQSAGAYHGSPLETLAITIAR
jgi:Protein of unknown function (DUF3891)